MSEQEVIHRSIPFSVVFFICGSIPPIVIESSIRVSSNFGKNICNPFPYYEKYTECELRHR